MAQRGLCQWKSPCGTNPSRCTLVRVAAAAAQAAEAVGLVVPVATEAVAAWAEEGGMRVG